MAFWEEVAERLGGSAGLGVGIAAAVVAPTLAPVLGRGLRAALKSSIKGYLLLSERTRGAVADAGERLQDLYAEAKAEVDASVTAGANGGARAVEDGATAG
jgi:hypothetical protein